ncbi:hypothetical protein OG257_04105 [Streptomyces sp. NBC_00683]|uniref:ScbA/BarX family gamma-butyrolactone biosynthesis protein n=1 Tax=Streptomyces sp. NBC_00683 TaxID=2903670 RepID=UPI002E325660|nr:ScbA/BarX family gamma-butyrolactone biosynthesis protein [Streptomyces sp. NBC_00683]
MTNLACTAPNCEPARPAPERLVGKTDTREVLVTGWHENTTDNHTVTADWPTRHAFYTQRSSYFSPLLFTETVRQALGLLAHTAYNIPLDYRMGWDSYSCRIAPNALRPHPAHSDVVMTISHQVRGLRRPRGPVRLLAKVDAVRDGRHLGTAEISYTAFPPALYNRLRGEHADARAAFARARRPEAPIPAYLVNRDRPSDVVLAPTSEDRIWQLRTDTSHQVLFDHPHDHVPGMVLLEAAHQADLLTTNADDALVTGMSFDFKRYVEFARPCWIETAPLLPDSDGLVKTQITGIQDGEEAFSGTVTRII